LFFAATFANISKTPWSLPLQIKYDESNLEKEMIIIKTYNLPVI
jgi:hypothetical protein